ncbi:MAG: hypothetical protein ACW99Q_16405, partial [Candidatus Kariarchaeaceae archaeon]
MEFIINGRVKNDVGKPLSGLSVAAFDNDIASDDDYLGVAVTNAQGEFKIKFSDEDFKGGFEILERKPDEYIVVRNDTRVLYRSEVRSEAKAEEFFDVTIRDESCSISNPMYCSSEKLEEMFNQSTNQSPVKALVNADAKTSKEERWSFDKTAMMIYNNKHWRGFFPSDQNLTFIRYVGGFWKRFYLDGDKVKGITHPYETPVEAPNIPSIKNYPG